MKFDLFSLLTLQEATAIVRAIADIACTEEEARRLLAGYGFDADNADIAIRQWGQMLKMDIAVYGPNRELIFVY